MFPLSVHPEGALLFLRTAQRSEIAIWRKENRRLTGFGGDFLYDIALRAKVSVGLEGDNRGFRSDDRFVRRTEPLSPLGQPKLSAGAYRKLMLSDHLHRSGPDEQRARPFQVSASYCSDSRCRFSL